MKKTKLGIALLLMLALVVTSGTYAYWVGSVTGPAADADTVGVVSIGVGEDVTTQYVVTGDDPQSVGLLVPSGFENDTTTFASRTVTWDLAWDVLAGTNSGTSTAPITVTVSWVAKDSLGTVVANSAGSVTDYTGAITVTANGTNPTSMTLDAAASTFSFDISMGEPATQAQYDLIADGSIEVTVTYSLGAVTTN